MPPDFFLRCWTTSCHDDECTITVRTSGAVFYLRWIPSELEAAPDLLADFQKSLSSLKNDDDDSEDEARKLAQPFHHVMSELNPPSPRPPFTLKHWFEPEWFMLVATIGEGNTIQPRRDFHNPYGKPGISRKSPSMNSLDLDKWVSNWYPSHNVQIVAPTSPNKNHFQYPPSKTLVEGNITCHFKGFMRGDRAAFREIYTYRKIAEALDACKIPPNIRICHLQGLVYNNDSSTTNQRIVGLLFTYIEPKLTSSPSTLTNAAFLANKETRQRWAKELATIIHRLHSIEVVWGDVKPDNILVDKNDGIWLIDFDGGYTSPWVSVGNCEKKEGDLEGLRNIINWLSEPSL